MLYKGDMIPDGDTMSKLERKQRGSSLGWKVLKGLHSPPSKAEITVSRDRGSQGPPVHLNYDRQEKLFYPRGNQQPLRPETLAISTAPERLCFHAESSDSFIQFKERYSGQLIENDYEPTKLELYLRTHNEDETYEIRPPTEDASLDLTFHIGNDPDAANIAAGLIYRYQSL